MNLGNDAHPDMSWQCAFPARFARRRLRNPVLRSNDEGADDFFAALFAGKAVAGHANIDREKMGACGAAPALRRTPRYNLREWIGTM
jgi:hypothetical protein